MRRLNYFARNQATGAMPTPRLDASATVPPRELWQDIPEVVAAVDALEASKARVRDHATAVADLRKRLETAEADYRLARRAAANDGTDPASIANPVPALEDAIAEAVTAYEDEVHTRDRLSREAGIVLHQQAEDMGGASLERARARLAGIEKAFAKLQAEAAGAAEDTGRGIALYRWALDGGRMGSGWTADVPTVAAPAGALEAAVATLDAIATELAEVKRWRALQSRPMSRADLEAARASVDAY